ncbi:DUF5689 domain-containing protein [Aurantibacter crassamenti]|uniref:DUF5689 domain-containing protein n=1 Tax=Aurantibacter crassamenti TaxID=1837375 RepID=UPI00293D4E63|nr:DUF5689 domain-containing protein [Aurantibacter crassamenti]
MKGRNFEPPESNCTSNVIANSKFVDVKNLYKDETIQIQDDLIIEGYVISSDISGNFFSVLHFQDKLNNPTEGFQIEIDFRDSYLFYPLGSKISIKLKGLYVGKSNEVYKIGGAFTSFGNVSVGRLPAAKVNQHIFIDCENGALLEPTIVEISDLKNLPNNTLVQLKDVQFIKEEIGLPYAIETEETERTIIDCSGAEMVVLNSGYSDFHNEAIPSENGLITGVLVRDKSNYQLIFRSLDDLKLNQTRCTGLENEFTSEQIFISEIADPDNNSEARFVELYNSNSKTISLNGWHLNRFTNENLEIGSTIDLSNYEILAESTLVIAANEEEFINVYGFIPDMVAGNNSPADSNGDDNFQMVDPFGKVIDAFGIIGEDGSNTNHEFEDGRALRKSNISIANPVFDANEWEIYNDSGGSGTTNQPQLAPDDFTAGIR